MARLKAILIRETTDSNSGEPIKQPRGFRLQAVRMHYPQTGETMFSVAREEKYYVRLGYQASQCNSEAHSSAHIDHCMICLKGTWGVKVTKVKE